MTCIGKSVYIDDLDELKYGLLKSTMIATTVQ